MLLKSKARAFAVCQTLQRRKLYDACCAFTKELCTRRTSKMNQQSRDSLSAALFRSNHLKRQTEVSGGRAIEVRKLVWDSTQTPAGVEKGIVKTDLVNRN
jgi:hypothetical protein